ncbi:cyclopropane-fatty-acyl-phospholipid synthase [Actinopolyspora xinjiangensis]|uniref:Cyclopropane-fatty-acyl-phospholipid synthase n=1 Tax=Actinopolyspora xinjiangensis TaxID=405564 RepID=A0A1H0T7H5_9ACTN|nr:cyclopropane-fatty-acyl-phospholipid synthase family protein [Actinopolyspora xinjiangensis]SDP49436.1 cyclopropane-fatty-acyl-phospholipid synthase [Actinopolyspora xinjiangensis]
MTTAMSLAASSGVAVWDAVGEPPRSPVRAAAAERLFRHAVRDLPVRVVLAGGERLGAGGDEAPLMRILAPEAFFHRLGVDAKIGFGESYMIGEWDSPDPAALLTPFARRLPVLVPRPLQYLRRWVDAARPEDERNTPAGAGRNVRRHYDLSNEVFATFLDETMTYSAGLFRPGITELATAQRCKLDRALDVAGVGEGTRLLEIGSGWGSLAIRAAERGARVTTLTLSEQQLNLARERIERAGVADRVDVEQRDYRHATGEFDAVVSIEMIEAVGAEYWSEFFATLDRLLVPGGRALVQAITMPHERMLATRGSHTWIHRYIFPGGQLPSTRAIERIVSEHTGLQLSERHAFGDSYAETLRRWRAEFTRQHERIAQLGFNERFRRMWEFYLAYSEAGFRARYLDVWQFALTKSTADGARQRG